MNNLVLCLNSVTPSFIIMIVGYFSRRIGLLTNDDVFKFNRIMFKVFFPIMLFNTIYNSDFSHSVTINLIAFVIAGILFEAVASFLIVHFATSERNRRGVMIQGMVRANTVAVGLPIAMELLGNVDLGPVVICIAVSVPLFSTISVVALEYFNGERVKVGKLLLNIAKNPLIIAAAVSLLFVGLKIKLPHILLSTVQSMAQGASPVTLFLVGAFFAFDKLGAVKKELIVSSAFRLLVFPGIILFIGYFMGFRDAAFVGLITVFASSAAVASFSMAQQMGGDADLAGNIVVVTSALCPITFFILSYLFKTLGAF